MNKRLLLLPLLALLLTGCGLRFFGGRRFNGGGPTRFSTGLAPSDTPFPTERPTGTPAPTATVSPTPVPNLHAIGLPDEAAGTNVYDFSANLCSADWKAGDAPLPCSGPDPSKTTGYVALIGGLDQGLPSSLNGIVMH